MRVRVTEGARLALDLRQTAGVARDGRARLVLIILAADVLALDRAARFLARQRLIFEQRTREQVQLVEMGGRKRVFGLNDLTRAQTTADTKAASLENAKLKGFL